MDQNELERERLAIERRRVEGDLEIRRLEASKSSWKNPLFLGIVAAVIGLVSNAIVAYVNGDSQRELETLKTEGQLILDSVKTGGNREEAARNLEFLVNSGLVRDATLSKRIRAMAIEEYPTLAASDGPLAGAFSEGGNSFRSLLALWNGNLISGRRWNVKTDFIEKNDVVDRNLGGGACVTKEYCIVASDRNRYVTAFRLILPRTIEPLDGRVYLRKTEKGDNKLDIEAVSYDRDGFLFVGSHSVSRSDGCTRPERHGVFLVPSDPLTSKIGRSSAETPLPGIKEASLDYILSSLPAFEPYYNGILQRGGVNVEGGVLDGDSVFFGVRAPFAVRQVLLLKVNKQELFNGVEPEPELVKIDVDRNGIGIRDIVRIDDGYLLLTGDSHAEAPANLEVECDHTNALDSEKIVGSGKQVGNPFELYYWDGEGGDAQLIGAFLGTFPNIEDIVKAEALLVLPRPWTNETTLSIMIFFDGIENGAPTSFEIPRRLLASRSKARL